MWLSCCFAVVAIAVLVKNYFAPSMLDTRVTVTKGSVFPEITGVDYNQAPRTLILALNVDCRYCTRSVPFYNLLTEARHENPRRFNIVAAFINNNAELVKSYADEKQLSVQTIAAVDLDKLGIHMTPAIVLVDSTGKVLDSWRGLLQPDGEREVFGALGLPYKAAAGSTSTATNVRKTADIFDEQKATLSVSVQTERQDDPAHFIEVFDVNGHGDVYVIHDKFMYTYDAAGRKNTSARSLPTSGARSALIIAATSTRPMDMDSQSSRRSSSRFETCRSAVGCLMMRLR